MHVLLDRSDRDAARALGGAWLAFVVALCLALPQPPNPVYLALGAVIGALWSFWVSSFVLMPDSQTTFTHRKVTGVFLAVAAGAALGALLLVVL